MSQITYETIENGILGVTLLLVDRVQSPDFTILFYRVSETEYETVLANQHSRDNTKLCLRINLAVINVAKRVS